MTRRDRTEARHARKRGRWWRWPIRIVAGLVLLSVLQVGVVRFVDPPGSAYMAARQVEAWRTGDDDYRLRHEWRDLDAQSAHLLLAVIAAEDQRFAEHRGFDLDQIRKARDVHARGGRLRGASTISQQVARNLFLWSGGGWIRKGLEAWYTLLIELMWSKSRIIEVYVNVAEFGDGVYGAQAAARRYFGRDAAALQPAQAARLAAVLPSPKRYSAASPGPYVRRRTGDIQRQMRQIGGRGYLERLD
jgi:monofunctional biosynthetic peptidoglycan transglycosylase